VAGSTAGATGLIEFTPAVDTTFDIAGGYALTGTGVIYLQLTLSEAMGSTIFENIQESVGTANENFAVGESGGDNQNTSTGATAGVLSAGTTYVLTYDFHILATGLTNLTGLGGFDFTLGGGPQVIPAPGSAALALLGLVVVRRIRRRRD
jgi:MYXO-CTERM domain-containing protein